MKNVLFALSVALLACISLSAGAEEVVVPIKITTWTCDESQLAMLSRFVDEFAAAKGIQIGANFESLDFQDYNSKLMTELSGEDAPDLYWVPETGASVFIAPGGKLVRSP